MNSRLIEELAGVVGTDGLAHGEQIEDHHRTNILRKSRSDPGAVVRPTSTEQVAGVLQIASASRSPVTALGGETGLVGGGIAEPGGILLRRLNQ